jgi:outer membrane protein assembly factor BamB
MLGFALRAGEPAAQLQKIILPGENKDSFAELLVADRLVDAKHSPQVLASIAGLGGTPGPLGPVPAFALERINQQQWAEAMEEYQRLIDEEGDNLVPASNKAGPTSRSVQLRRLCQRRMAAAPPSALAQHQKRVAALADKLFREGKERHALEPLERLVNDLFCSRSAGPALELLGDLAFERGDFAKALSWWRLLELPASEVEGGIERQNVLLVPDSPADPARIHGKQTIALAFLGDRARAEAELKAFLRLHPKAQGKLAGREGMYGKIVDKIIRDLPADEVGDEPWTTFAGSPTRNRVSPSPSDRWWADGPTWQIGLVSEKNLLPRPGGKRPLAYHPIIFDDKVLVADDRTVTGYQLLTGKPLFRYDPFGPGVGATPSGTSFSLTASAGRIYARLAKQNDKTEKTHLMCLEMVPVPGTKDRVQVRERWQAQAKDATFEGAPLVHDGWVYIAQGQSTDKRTRTSLACYDADSGKLRWLQEMCDTPDQSGKPRNHVLTLADSQVIFSGDAGAIVAVDSRTGKPKWGLRYPSRGLETKNGLPSPRDLCPPVFADGRLFIAPADSDRIFCLDSLTGQILWERSGIEVVHLLGVARGRLIFSTPQGLQAIGAATGLDLGGWLKPDVGTLPPQGRGLLAGDWVFWPTRDTKFPVRAVTQEQGEQEDLDPSRLRLLRPGNMALGNGCFVVAGPDELIGYVSPKRLLENRQTEAGQPSASLRSLYLLAQAQAETGREDLALANFKRVAESDDPEQWQSWPIQALALERRHDLLLDLARRAEKRQALPEATSFLHQASGAEFPIPSRLLAKVRLAETWNRVGQAGKAVAAWQSILQNDDLREGIYFSHHGSPQSAAVLAKTSIQELLDKHGAAAYAGVEKQATAAHTQARGSIASLEKLVRHYPQASAVPLALAELAGLQEKAGRFGAAAQSYRHLLQTKAVDPAPALVGLARVYEKQHCYAAAKETWLLLSRNYSDKMMQGRPVRDLAAEHLRNPAFQDLPIKSQAWSCPLTQTWIYPADKLLLPNRNALSPDPPIVFLAGTERLSAHDAANCQERWSRKLPFTPTWLGLHADVVLAADKQGIAAVRLEDGEPIWTFTPGTPDHTFSRFHLTTTQLLFLDEERRLLALDLETGRVAWSQWAPGAAFPPLGGGGFSPHFHGNADRVVAQTSSGRRLVFAAARGKQLHEGSAAASWTQDPLSLDKQRLCLVEKSRILVVDSATWKELWSYTPSWPSSWTGEAVQVTWNGKVLLILIPRNYGFELDRLDPRTGKSLWQQPCLLSHDRIDARTISMNEGCLFYAGDGVLTCRSLADSRRLWHKSLPSKSRRWQTLHQADAVIAHPAEYRQAPWLWLPLGNMLLAVPNHDDVRTRPLTVCCHHAKDGRLLQRMEFSAPACRVEVQPFAKGMVIRAGDVACGFSVAEKR